MSRASEWIIIYLFHTVHPNHNLDGFNVVGAKASHVFASSLIMFNKLAEILNIPLNHDRTVYHTTIPVVHDLSYIP